MDCLRATFEHISESRMEELLTHLEEMGFEIMADDVWDQWLMVEPCDVKRPKQKLRDAVWKFNGGACCSVKELTYDEADEYL